MTHDRLDAMRDELREATEALNDPAVNNLRTLPEAIRILRAKCDKQQARIATLEALVLEVMAIRGDQYADWCDRAAAALGGNDGR